MAKNQTVPEVALTTPTPQQPIQQPATEVLPPLREYTREDLAKATQINELGKYFRFPIHLEEKLRQKTNRADLEMDDFISVALKNAYGIGVTPLQISRKWNNRHDIELRIGLRQPVAKTPVMADNKPVPLATPTTPMMPISELTPSATIPKAEFIPPQDTFNKWIIAQLKIHNESTVIEWLLKNGKTEEQIKPYFKSLNV